MVSVTLRCFWHVPIAVAVRDIRLVSSGAYGSELTRAMFPQVSGETRLRWSCTAVNRCSQARLGEYAHFFLPGQLRPGVLDRRRTGWADHHYRNQDHPSSASSHIASGCSRATADAIHRVLIAIATNTLIKAGVASRRSCHTRRLTTTAPHHPTGDYQLPNRRATPSGQHQLHPKASDPSHDHAPSVHAVL